MHVSEDFARGVRILLGCALVLVAALFLVTSINPPGRVQAQNAGVVGIQAKLQAVFPSQPITAAACSPFFNDIGQGSNNLFISDPAGGAAVIDLEWSPTKVAPFYVISQASYNDATSISSTHVLTANGYFPNMRSCLTTYTSGTWSAWFSAISGPVAYAAPALGSNGQTSPVACDQSSYVPVGTGTNIFLGPQALNSGNVVYICSVTVSFGAATSAATDLNFTWNTTALCAGPSEAYDALITASTPQTYSIPTQMRSIDFGATVKNFLCVNNTSGATADFLISWASVRPQ